MNFSCRKGFTLIECLVSLIIFSIIITMAFQVYLTGYRFYLRSESQVEVEQGLRIAAGRITDHIRALDNPAQGVSRFANRLTVGAFQYYLQQQVLLEFKDGRANQLAVHITRFQPVIQDGFLHLTLESRKGLRDPAYELTVTIFLGN